MIVKRKTVLSTTGTLIMLLYTHYPLKKGINKLYRNMPI